MEESQELHNATKVHQGERPEIKGERGVDGSTPEAWNRGVQREVYHRIIDRPAVGGCHMSHVKHPNTCTPRCLIYAHAFIIYSHTLKAHHYNRRLAAHFLQARGGGS